MNYSHFDTIYLVTDIALVVVCFIMFAFFIGVKNLPFVNNPNYKTSLKALAIAYIIFGILNTIDLFLNHIEPQPQIFPFIALVIACFQALLFSFTLITLYNPNFVTRKIVVTHSLPIALLVISYVMIRLFFDSVSIASFAEIKVSGGNPEFIVRVLLFIFFVFQLIAYTKITMGQDREYRRQLLNYSSETEKLNLRWVRIAFLAALSIATTILIYNIYPSKIFGLFVNIAVIIFYFGFGVNYLNYNKIYINISNIFIDNTAQSGINLKQGSQKVKWDALKNKILDERLYLKEGLTLEELAQTLLVGRTTLSNLINQEENVNFNVWINTLRIEEAKKIFIATPEYSILQVSELVGFSEQSNFSREFKKITGVTPSCWKQQYILQSI